MSKQQITALSVIGAAVAISLGAYAFLGGLKQVPMQAYANAEYDISFEYPQTYSLEERDTAGRHTIVIADKEALAEAPQNGEGPTAITVDIFDNPKRQTPSVWVRSDQASNFQLSDGTLASSTVSGKESVAYLWDGLYRGESYVFTHKDNILMFSVTYLTPQDQIKKDFTNLLKSLKIQ